MFFSVVLLDSVFQLMLLIAVIQMAISADRVLLDSDQLLI